MSLFGLKTVPIKFYSSHITCTALAKHSQHILIAFHRVPSDWNCPFVSVRKIVMVVIVINTLSLQVTFRAFLNKLWNCA